MIAVTRGLLIGPIDLVSTAVTSGTPFADDDDVAALNATLISDEISRAPWVYSSAHAVRAAAFSIGQARLVELHRIRELDRRRHRFHGLGEHAAPR